MNDIIRYIIQFLVGPDAEPGITGLIGYTSDETSFHHYKIVILPSGFFDGNIYGTTHSLPVLPLKYVDDVPILFGLPVVERKKDTLIVHADIIAGSFFLLSRYEEIVKRGMRDLHGRFPGKESLPYRAGFMHRPVVDEYGILLRNWLKDTGIKIKQPAHVFRQIKLTHDVDAPFYMRTWRNIVRGIKEGNTIFKLLKAKYGPLTKDLFYTFPWILHKNEEVQRLYGRERCSSIFFLKAGGNEFFDKPWYDLKGKDIRTLIELICSHHGIIGLHSSYQAGKHPDRILKEKRELENRLDMPVTANRHHYLALREPEDMRFLEEAGITDDYTMGYADVAGFRIGTSRPAKWMDPTQKRLSGLMLHPLNVMDNTLDIYMGLSMNEAAVYCFDIMNRIKKAGGDLTLLWHNSTVAEGYGYHRELYAVLIEQLVNDFNLMDQA